MRFEIVLLLITAFIMANIYTEGKYVKVLLSGKKYYQMAGVAFAALMLYVLIKKNPLRAQEIVSASNEYIKYLPIDRNTSNIISPILDFTSKQQFYNTSGGDGTYSSYNYPVLPMNKESRSEKIMMQSGKTPTKRSVSETKKKFVASRQGWNCSACGKQLTATFEIDHIKRLEYGGDNHIDNLTAMCKSCHGDKTMMENL